MNRFPALLSMILLFQFAVAAVAQIPPKGRNTVRLVSYNIRNAKGLDDKVNQGRIARIIAAFDADFVALQELDSCTQRYNKDFFLGKLASITGMEAIYAPAIHFQGGKYGIGLLSKKKAKAWKYYPLPGKEEERVLLVAEFRDCFILNTHFSLTEADQLRSLDAIIAVVAQLNKPCFLMGDLNASPGSEVIKRLNEQLTCLTDTTAHTFPADKPDTTIDYIFTSKSNTGYIPQDRWVINEPQASDHRPVGVDIHNRVKIVKQRLVGKDVPETQ